jgi:uncharacterized RDD family membrane protein YckC
MKYAGLITRCLAFFVDSVMILILQIIAVSIFSFLFGLLMPIIPDAAETVTDTFVYASVYETLITFVVWWIYFSSLDSSHKQATLGKQMLGLKVVDYSGNKIGFWRASLRYAGMYISIVLLPITLFVVALSSKKQGLHDMVARCLVVYR